MRTIRIKAYKFNELSEQAKEEALQHFADINVNFQWWECVYEDAANIGLRINGFAIDRGSFCDGEFTLSAFEVATNIIRDHGTMCETYKTADNFINEVNNIQNLYPDMEGNEYENAMIQCEDDFLKAICEDYRVMLSNEYDYLTSEEAIIKTIEANEYEFNIDGKMM